MVNVSSVYYDLAGCLSANEKHVFAGSKSHRFIERHVKANLHDRIKVDKSPLLLNSTPSHNRDSSEESGSVLKAKGDYNFFKKLNAKGSLHSNF